LTGYILERIQLQFAILSKGTPAEGASLFQQPAQSSSRNDIEYTTDSFDWPVPSVIPGNGHIIRTRIKCSDMEAE
jgi:hypothetical protein